MCAVIAGECDVIGEDTVLPRAAGFVPLSTGDFDHAAPEKTDREIIFILAGFLTGLAA
jgi:hypothetical protein